MARRKKAARPGLEPRETRVRGKAGTSHDTEAEQVREAAESARAKEAESSIRDRMVDIGRGNKQAGRQTKP